MRRRSGDCPGGRVALQIRLRRMICFLRYHDLTVAARELGAATRVFFDVDYMEFLMDMGLWEKAEGYLQRFLPTPQYASPRSMSLVIYIRSARYLATVAIGRHTTAGFASNFNGLKGPAASYLCRVLHDMLADQSRAYMLWEKYAPSAVDKAMDMLFECPELKGKLHLPRGKPKPWEIIPLFGARASPSRRTKLGDRTPPYVIVRALKRQKRSLSTLDIDAYSEHQKEKRGELSPSPSKQGV